MQALKFLLICPLLLFSPDMLASQADYDESLQALAADFFEWRRVQQPVSGDDIPRVERPEGWVPDFSPGALDEYRQRYHAFLQAVDQLDNAEWSIGNQVDAQLLKAAIERLHWELDILKLPQRNPLFYLDQTLGSIFELLVLSSPITASRAQNILLRLEHFPSTLKSARINLDQAIRPFAAAAIETLAGIDERLLAVQTALQDIFPAELGERLAAATKAAIKALENYREWLRFGLDTMQTAFAIGPHAYQWFLTHVALIPYTPGELLAQGQQAWNRSVTWDVIEKNRNRNLHEMPLFKSADQQIQASSLKENEIRALLESSELMTVPGWLQHYRIREIPHYLEPLSFMGVNDDLTSENRLDEDAYSYIPEPAEDLPYFRLASARDPRPLIIHEGIPGHYFQLALSWANPNPIRRRYIDSSANEGIGFYVEELLLQAGLFDYSPRSREIMHSFMRLRALRVEVDIRLALGDFTIEQAGDYLARTVPMDRETAFAEAVFFAFNPGQAISYQIGKLQILQFLSDAKLDQGEDFSLRHFHDYLMENGNVPIALQRWEYLGRDDQVLRLEVLGGKPVTVPQ
ncbi:MAG: DUF885 family protein [Proteobacteria bacterium]|nr:DUF885 family protein [Pseudomonadota bacterium]